jgi:hypothetical protein
MPVHCVGAHRPHFVLVRVAGVDKEKRSILYLLCCLAFVFLSQSFLALQVCLKAPQGTARCWLAPGMVTRLACHRILEQSADVCGALGGGYTCRVDEEYA